MLNIYDSIKANPRSKSRPHGPSGIFESKSIIPEHLIRFNTTVYACDLCALVFAHIYDTKCYKLPWYTSVMECFVSLEAFVIKFET